MFSFLHCGGGVLPFCEKDGEVLYLLHMVEEKSSKKYGMVVDFGGGYDKQDKSKYHTAAREWFEEICWYYGDKSNASEEIENLAKKLKELKHDIATFGYFCCPLKIDYKPANEICEYCNSSKTEKQRSFKWYSHDEMMKFATEEGSPLHPRINRSKLKEYLLSK